VIVQTPTVRELSGRIEAVTPDPFLDSLPRAAPKPRHVRRPVPGRCGQVQRNRARVSWRPRRAEIT
jgi:hypothetical protein